MNRQDETPPERSHGHRGPGGTGFGLPVSADLADSATEAAITEATEGPGTLPGGAAPLGRAVTSGMTWMSVLSVVARLAAVAAQLILASLLSQGDFGVYAAALAVSNLVAIFRDGGVREVLIKESGSRYHELVGPVFWLALTVNTLVALALAGVAPMAAGFYQMPALTLVLLVIAASLPLGTPAAILMCRLRIDLRFRELSRITTVSALLRYALTVGLAAAGAGPVSFVAPLIGVALYEWWASYRLVRERPWRSDPGPRLWAPILRQSCWLFLGALAGMLMDQGAYLVSGRFIVQEALGVLFFAAQLVHQSVYVLVSYTASLVLFPALVRLASEPARRAAAALRFERMLMLLAVPGCFGLALVFDPLEAMLFGGKWAEAVPVLQVLCLGYPMRCTIGLTTAVLLGEGRFKRWSLFTMAEGLLLTAAAGLAAALDGRPLVIASALCAAMIVSRAAVVAASMVKTGAPAGEALWAMAHPMMIGLLAAAFARGADDLLLHGMTPGARFVLLGLAFSAAFAALVRLVLARSVEDALSVIPARLAGPARRLMLMRPAHGARR